MEDQSVEELMALLDILIAPEKNPKWIKKKDRDKLAAVLADKMAEMKSRASLSRAEAFTAQDVTNDERKSMYLDAQGKMRLAQMLANFKR